MKFVAVDVFRDAFDAAAGHGFEPGFGQGDAEVLLLVLAVVLDLALLAQADREVVVHRLIIEEIFLDHVAAIAQAQHEIAKP